MACTIEEFFEALRPAEGLPQLEVRVTDVFSLNPVDAIGLTFVGGKALIPPLATGSPIEVSPSGAPGSIFHYEHPLSVKPFNMSQYGHLVLRATLAAAGEGAELWVSGDGEYAVLTGAGKLKAEQVAGRIREAVREASIPNIRVTLQLQ